MSKRFTSVPYLTESDGFSALSLLAYDGSDDRLLRDPASGLYALQSDPDRLEPIGMFAADYNEMCAEQMREWLDETDPDDVDEDDPMVKAYRAYLVSRPQVARRCEPLPGEETFGTMHLVPCTTLVFDDDAEEKKPVSAILVYEDTDPYGNHDRVVLDSSMPWNKSQLADFLGDPDVILHDCLDVTFEDGSFYHERLVK